MFKNSFSPLLEISFHGLVMSFMGLLVGFVMSLFLYGFNRLAMWIFDFYRPDYVVSLPLYSSMMVGAILGGVFGAWYALKHVK